MSIRLLSFLTIMALTTACGSSSSTTQADLTHNEEKLAAYENTMKLYRAMSNIEVMEHSEDAAHWAFELDATDTLTCLRGRFDDWRLVEFEEKEVQVELLETRIIRLDQESFYENEEASVWEDVYGIKRLSVKVIANSHGLEDDQLFITQGRSEGMTGSKIRKGDYMACYPSNLENFAIAR